jgi:NAD(P)-dependent dehydrogenase (short-subunit alcohol dehydrogenase family)
VSARLEERVALVTGGASGIGRAIAGRFASEGARVVIGDLDARRGNELTESLGEGAAFHRLDVSDESSFSRAIESVAARWERLDILVNNAGVVFPALPVHETSTPEFDRLVAVNLRGTYLGCKLAFPHLRKTRGCVLNISSLVGIEGERSHAVYGATKGAVNALTKCTAADWREYGVRINALCPSDVWTDALEAWCQDQGDEVIAHYRKMRTGGYCAEPEEIATIAAFLCSEESRFINGAIIPASFAAECGYEI